jgi:hypothetical protein
MKLLLLLSLLFLVGCASGDAGAGDPVRVVERYLTAKVAGDGDTVRALLCSAMEADAGREATAFSAIEARIDNMQCARGEGDSVTCTGTIIALYGTEETTFPLGSYTVVQEDGEWKWCGER